MTEIPAGFEPLFRTSPFLELLGPFFYRRTTNSLVIGLRVEDKHTNARGTAHGGLLLTLADIALGYTAAFSADPPLSLTTANICADLVGYARVGDWIEAHVDIQRIGSRLVFANAYLLVGSERIARTSAVFARNAGALGAGPRDAHGHDVAGAPLPVSGPRLGPGAA
jgi:acyl-coenzyme A thioesterase PaaI-like protein